MTGHRGIEGRRTHAAGRPVSVPEQPVLVAETSGIERSVGAFEHNVQLQPVPPQGLGAAPIPRQPKGVRWVDPLSLARPLGDTETEAKALETARRGQITHIAAHDHWLPFQRGRQALSQSRLGMPGGPGHPGQTRGQQSGQHPCPPPARDQENHDGGAGKPSPCWQHRQPIQ